MNKFMTGIVVIAATAFSSFALATNVGVIDMKKIFKDSAKVKRMNNSLKSTFAGRRKALMKLSDTLKDDVDKLQKERAVMKKKEVAELNEKVVQEGTKLRKQQADFQESLMEAQKTAMEKFMNELQAAAKKSASAKKIDVVLPKGSTVYASSSIDLTDSVLKQLG